MKKPDKKKALLAVEAARKNGGVLFHRVAGCAAAVDLGWLEVSSHRNKVSVGGGRVCGLSRYERLYGWLTFEWKVTDKAPVLSEGGA
jgi:hypothetical protein